MARSLVKFFVILIVLHLANGLISTTSKKNRGVKAQDSPKELVPNFEEEWAALDLGDDVDDDDFLEDEQLPYFPSSSASDMLPPGMKENDRTFIQQPQPNVNENRLEPARALQNQATGPNRLVSQLVEEMKALGIDQVEVDLLNLTASSAFSASVKKETPRPTLSRFLIADICGEKFLCRQGDRGPCRPNEIFLPQVNVSSSAVISSSCSGLLASPWNGCFPAKRVGSLDALSRATPGVCTVRFRSRPCFGYPPGYRYSKSTRRCYPCSMMNQRGRGLSVSGPCSPNKIFVDTDGVYGSCRCRDPSSLLFSGDNSCYSIYSRGPCSEGEWLEPLVNGYGQCKRSPCPSNKCDGRHIYWKATPWSRGGCYRSFARGPCRHGSYFLIEDYATKKGRCVSRYESPFNPNPAYGNPLPAMGRVGLVGGRFDPWKNGRDRFKKW